MAHARSIELVVSLRQPGLAAAAKAQRSLAALTSTRGRLDLASPVSVSYVQQLRREQARVAARIERAVPGARVRWHYTITFDGLAVVVAQNAAKRLATVNGVARVWSSARFHSQLDRTPQLIGAPQLWGPTLATAGQGVKIGIIDEGVDQTHPFLSPAGFTMPPGYPKGNTSFTTAKVIVARAFPPASPKWKYANLPFDPQFSEHGTHVAGIAAGDHGTRATGCSAGCPATVSGIAPAAYIGNYKALTIPTPGFGLDGNAPEIAKAIEAAVADGMDVINLSLGEPEIPPSRDIVVKAIDGAAAAGVVPVIAAGNDFEDFGRGSVSSPGNAPDAITAAASTTGRSGPADRIASFSSGGPTPISLEMKPDVTGPGVDVLSSVPAREGSWALFSGTSMATPHVAGAAALLRQRHPTWSVAQIKSALEQTGDPVQQGGVSGASETSSMREGGGRIDLPRADNPLIFASPTGMSFGMLVPPADAQRTVTLSDAGGGSGTWNVSVTQPLVSAPATVSVPGQLVLHVNVAAGASESEASGFVVLTRGSDVRRIPWWVGISHPTLARPVRTLARTGTYRGNAAKGRAGASEYRYPEPDLAPLNGPEEVFAVRVGNVANFGTRIVSHRPAVRVTPRIVFGDDQNRLAGYTALPFDFNPYRSLFGRAIPAAGVILPTAGTYGLVFDTPSRAQAGAFTFRFWVNDVSPPRIRFRSYSRGTIRVSLTDAGSGVDPASISVSVDGGHPPPTYRNGLLTVREGLAPGKHRLVVTASDYQEAKNMEDVGPILPNTRTYSHAFVVR